MKKILISLFIAATCFVLPISLLASYTAESALGTWLVPKGDAKITIYKCGDKLCGKLSWMKTPNDLDEKNPDPAKRNNKLLGMNILWGFNFNSSEWVGGYIYDPDSGDTYKCKMWLNDSDHLSVKGYVGVSLLGRSEVWARVK